MKQLLARHVGVLRRTDGSLGLLTIASQWGAPIVAAAVVWWFDLTMDVAVATGLLTVAGLFAAFSFQLAVQMMARAAAFDDARPGRSAQTTREVRVAEMLAASAAYASLVSLAATGASLGAALSNPGWSERVFVTLATLTVAHMAVTIAFLVVSVFRLTLSHLESVETSRSGPRAA